MITVKPECRENALGMLAGKFSSLLGWVGNIRYHLVDGKVWSVNTVSGNVARCDNPDENERLIKMVRELNKETV